MQKKDVYKALQEIRESHNAEDILVCDRIFNYMEANIDEFIECYESVGDKEETNKNV